MSRDTKTPNGFSDEKGAPNYWLDAVRDFWTDTDMDTDTEEVRWIVNWFNARRADANLLAAAPRLLEVCKSLLGVFENLADADDLTEDDNDTWDELLEVIAQAEGVQQ